jgi:uncharacterized protein (TIGR03382 family)
VDGYGGQAQVAIASAAAGEELRARLDARVDAAGSLGIVSTSVGEIPAVIDCVISRVEPVEQPEEEEGEGCTCSSTIASGGGPALSILLVLLATRRARRRARRL